MRQSAWESFHTDLVSTSKEYFGNENSWRPVLLAFFGQGLPGRHTMHIHVLTKKYLTVILSFPHMLSQAEARQLEKPAAVRVGIFPGSWAAG